MKLIDVDRITTSEIIKFLGKEYAFCAPDIEEMLRKQPIAYDLERVINRLEYRKKIVEGIEPDCDDNGECLDGETIYSDGVVQGKYIAYGEALRVVEEGILKDEKEMVRFKNID